jgi:hypothetical protein
MSKRIFLAGVAGGLALFIWSAVSHMVLPLGEVGVKSLPDTVVSAMTASLTAGGFYFFPGMAPSAQDDPEAMAAWTRRYEEGPRGILVYWPGSTKAFAPMLFVRELLSNIAVGLLLAWLAVRAGLTTRARWVAVVVVGFAAAIETNFSQWNWYGFPNDYTMAQMTDVVVGYAIMGAVIAALTRGAAPPAA